MTRTPFAIMTPHDCPSLHADPDGCPVVVGMAHNATQDVLVCNRSMPCPLHNREAQ